MDNIRWQSKPIYPKGILCGSDQAQEWLLPWWWSRLRDHNDYPVAFCDFGMSREALQWCRERGEVIPARFELNTVAPKETFSSDVVHKWEAHYTDKIWDFRQVWFKKPLAFLHSLFQQTLWLDLDCEVLASLEGLFELCHAGEETGEEIGIMRDFCCSHLPRFHPENYYNGGVIVYEHGSSLIEKWAAECLTRTDQFWSDDFLLSDLINTLHIPVQEIPHVFNWRISQGINVNAVICHWLGVGGKTLIREFGGFKPILEKFF